MKNTTRILIADDHPVVRRGLRSLIATRKGWEVCGEAQTGTAAVDMVLQLNPDVLIMDISMPDMNGIEALRKIQASDLHPATVILTMHLSGAKFHEAMEAGAHAYVLKSDMDEQLIEAVEALCEGRAFFSPGMSQTIFRSFVQGGGRSQPELLDLDALTPRQQEVVRLLAQGKTNKEVASALGISTRTAETHRRQIMLRLKAETLSELVLFAVRNHLVDV